jgi:hypothetical protein
MKVTLLNINIEGVHASYTPSGISYTPTGVCTFRVNNKVVQVVVHPAGELDVECVGDTLSDEEQDALMDTFDSSSRISRAFSSSCPSR